MKLLLVLLCFLSLAACSSSKFDYELNKRVIVAKDSDILPFIVQLADTVDLDEVTKNIPNLSRPKAVYTALSEKAQSSQGPLIAELTRMGVQFRSYWIVNMIAVKANTSVINAIASRDDVRLLESNHPFRVPLEQPDLYQPSNVSLGIEWNIQWVLAPFAWSKGFRGENMVVANADTGVEFDHPALEKQYRGYFDEDVFLHDYNWWDAIHESTRTTCGPNSKFPCDDNNHGTHTTGTAVGQDCDNPDLCNLIGVAPEAEWIACRNMDAGVGTAQTYIECLQFFVAPTDLEGKNPDPSKAPHVIGNSYGCPPSEGCSSDSLAAAVRAVVSAGIFMSVSAGNDGPTCSTISDPPAIYGDVFSVGALSLRSNAIAAYSSRGPVTADRSNRIKPNLVAPGSAVRSCVRGGGYAVYSGTSMASPHITGAIALLWQAKPEYERDVLATMRLLENTADPLFEPVCGSLGDQNNVYGFGGLNIMKALDSRN
eukprot:TRINITY_DN169_c0_g1_i4.p1 TRINITY_DN169_c0_g1~~TRINITY_DN169_c0_g1_i4.p1  ORF type:complete len:483 (-),score=115.10 TRINITY_DN169_c0_g1_i4:39-1487(-)